jgi:hypothetical protein
MRFIRPLLAAALAATVAVAAGAELAPLPGELTISEAPSNTQNQPAVALVRDGSLVVWADDVRGILGRRFAASGAARDRPQLLAANDPLPPVPFRDRVRHEAHAVTIAARPDGSFLAVWVDVKLKHSDDGFAEHRLVVSQRVAARFFDAEGRPVSRVWMLSRLASVASGPQVAPAGNRFLVTWYERAGPQPGVHLTAVGRKGPARDVLVGGRGTRPAVAAGGQGAIVAWLKCCSSQGGHDLLAQRVDAGGNLAGQSFLVASGLPLATPTVGGRPGGDFLVAYQRRHAPELSTRIHGQVVSAQGALVGGELALSGDYGTGHSAPVAAALPGGWVVGWVTWRNEFRVGATLVALGALGNALGNPVDLNEMPIAGLRMGLAAASDGRLLAAWEGFDARGTQGLRARAARAH